MATSEFHSLTRFFDSHAHLGDSAFDGDRAEVIQRARDAGAEGIVCIGSVFDADGPAGKIAAENAGFVSWTTGAHPHEASSFDPSRDIDLIRESVLRGASGIGECGLDYHYDNSPRDVQRTVFEAQIKLALEMRKPLVVHTREAEDDTLAMLQSAGAGARGVLHCYTGSARLAEAALEMGWYISFSGIVTFKAWTGDDVVRLVPRERILAESDAPYLAPLPHRGKRNEPAWVARTVEKLAAIRGETMREMGDLSIANARTFFGLGG